MKTTETRSPSRGLLAGEVAKAMGVGVQTLHFYEREGLIPPPRRSQSGYRLYTAELVARVSFIRKAKALGLPLDEIRAVLRLADEGASPCGRVQASLRQKLREVDRRLLDLQSFRDELGALIDRSATLRVADETQLCAIVEDSQSFVSDSESLALRQLRAR